LILAIPRCLELSVYEGIPHLLAVVTDMRQACECAQLVRGRNGAPLQTHVRAPACATWRVSIRRCATRSRPRTDSHPLTSTPDNPDPLHEMSLIVVVIDELADLMMVVGKKVGGTDRAHRAEGGGAAGIHLILATQRPSVDVITGLIKATSRRASRFRSRQGRSRTISTSMGAEACWGRATCCSCGPARPTQRVHGAFVSDQEVHSR